VLLGEVADDPLVPGQSFRHVPPGHRDQFIVVTKRPADMIGA
jgi:hypothetical protein